MSVVVIECLRCGRLRDVVSSSDHVDDAGVCPRCAYVGWACSDDLTEDERRELRDLPVEERRFEVVVDDATAV
jgi:hypothetical protein